MFSNENTSFSSSDEEEIDDDAEEIEGASEFSENIIVSVNLREGAVSNAPLPQAAGEIACMFVFCVSIRPQMCCKNLMLLW